MILMYFRVDDSKSDNETYDRTFVSHQLHLYVSLNVSASEYKPISVYVCFHFFNTVRHNLLRMNIISYEYRAYKISYRMCCKIVRIIHFESPKT